MRAHHSQAIVGGGAPIAPLSHMRDSVVEEVTNDDDQGSLQCPASKPTTEYLAPGPSDTQTNSHLGEAAGGEDVRSLGHQGPESSISANLRNDPGNRTGSVAQEVQEDNPVGTLEHHIALCFGRFEGLLAVGFPPDSGVYVKVSFRNTSHAENQEIQLVFPANLGNNPENHTDNDVKESQVYPASSTLKCHLNQCLDRLEDYIREGLPPNSVVAFDCNHWGTRPMQVSAPCIGDVSRSATFFHFVRYKLQGVCFRTHQSG